MSLTIVLYLDRFIAHYFFFILFGCVRSSIEIGLSDAPILLTLIELGPSDGLIYLYCDVHVYVIMKY